VSGMVTLISYQSSGGDQGRCDAKHLYVMAVCDAKILLRFTAKIRVSAYGCWVWTGSLSPNGYARFSVANRPVYAHRWSYEHFVGPIPRKRQIDHLCRIRNCVNPAHLEAVTQRVNLLRGESLPAQYAKADECVNGHSWDLLNTHFRPDGSRYCRACGRDRERARKERLRSAA
jgi:HNH endonuclease